MTLLSTLVKPANPESLASNHDRQVNSLSEQKKVWFFDQVAERTIPARSCVANSSDCVLMKPSRSDYLSNVEAQLYPSEIELDQTIESLVQGIVNKCDDLDKPKYDGMYDAAKALLNSGPDAVPCFAHSISASGHSNLINWNAVIAEDVKLYYSTSNRLFSTRLQQTLPNQIIKIVKTITESISDLTNKGVALDQPIVNKLIEYFIENNQLLEEFDSDVYSLVVSEVVSKQLAGHSQVRIAKRLYIELKDIATEESRKVLVSKTSSLLLDFAMLKHQIANSVEFANEIRNESQNLISYNKSLWNRAVALLTGEFQLDEIEASIEKIEHITNLCNQLNNLCYNSPMLYDWINPEQSGTTNLELLMKKVEGLQSLKQQLNELRKDFL